MPRLIAVPLATGLTLVAIANPAAASDNARVPTWPTHPKPITEYATQPPGPPQWPTDPEPLTSYRTSVQTSDGDFDWGSAGIGAGAGIVVLAAGLAGVGGVRRRRQSRPHAVGTP
jgi:hypothetical protein